MTWLRPGVRFSRPSFQAHQHMWQTAHLPKPRCSGHIEPVKHPHRCCINLKWFKWLVIKENIQFKERLEVGTKHFFSYLAMYHLHRSSYWSSYLSRCMSILYLITFVVVYLYLSVDLSFYMYVLSVNKIYIYVNEDELRIDIGRKNASTYLVASCNRMRLKVTLSKNGTSWRIFLGNHDHPISTCHPQVTQLLLVEVRSSSP